MGEVEELSQTYFWTCLSNSPTVSLFPLSLPTHGFRQIKNFNTRHLKEKEKKRFLCLDSSKRKWERIHADSWIFLLLIPSYCRPWQASSPQNCGSRTGYPFELPGTGTVLGATQTFWVGISGVWGLANCMVNGPQNGLYEPCIWEPPMQTFCLRVYVVDKECDVNVPFWVRIGFGWTSIF